MTTLSFPKFEQPDFISVFDAAQKYKAGQIAIESTLQRQQRDVVINQLKGDILNAPANSDKRHTAESALARFAPDEYQTLQTNSLNLEKKEEEAKIARNRSALSQVEQLLNSADQALQNPALYSQLVQQAAQSGYVNAAALPQQFESQEQFTAFMGQQKEYLTKLKENILAGLPQDTPKLGADEASIVAQFGLPVNDPDSYKDPRVIEAIAKRNQAEMAGRKKGSGNTTINLVNGQIPLTKANQTEYGKALIEGRQSLVRLQYLENFKAEDYLTYRARGKKLLFRVAGKAEISTKKMDEYAEKANNFTQVIEQEFNSYRKKITGAAASVQELEMLRKSMLNTDQSPAEFNASRRRYIAELKRADRLYTDLLKKGIDPRTPEGGDAFDAEFTDKDAAIERRDQELLRDGVTDPTERGAIMEKEGLLDEQP